MRTFTKLYMFILLGISIFILMCTTSCGENECTLPHIIEPKDETEWDELCCVHIIGSPSITFYDESERFSWALISSEQCNEEKTQYDGKEHRAVVLFAGNKHLYVNKARDRLKGDSFDIKLDWTNCTFIFCFEEFKKTGGFKYETKTQC